MQKIKSKKGFTLAELLIVVAIIAVLTAIAVPLFVSALGDAKDKVKDANKRAVRAAAVVYILEHQSGEKADEKVKITEGTEIFSATATLDKSGNIQTLTVQKSEGAVMESYDDSGDTIQVVVEVKATDVKSA